MFTKIRAWFPKTRSRQFAPKQERNIQTKIRKTQQAGADCFSYTYNNLGKLPDNLGKLTQLRWLYLSHNQLRSLPDSISNLTKLHTLDLDYNQFRSLPDSIGKLTSLIQLELNNNQLQTLPKWIGNLTQLSGLGLQNNQLQTLPPELSNLTQLAKLNLSENDQLTDLPRGLKLHSLDTSGCSGLYHLPDNLVVTGWLDLADTGITALPTSAQVGRLRWRGVPIDERIAFRPETITAQEVLTETDDRKRHVLLRRMGYERFMRETQPVVLDTDQFMERNRQLLRIERMDDDPLVYLSAIYGSERLHFIRRVPSETITCGQADAWIVGFDDA